LMARMGPTQTLLISAAVQGIGFVAIVVLLRLMRSAGIAPGAR
jgi:hypothetical protein